MGAWVFTAFGSWPCRPSQDQHQWQNTGGYPFLGAESCTEQFPLAPFKGPSAVESGTHSCQPLVQGLEFCTRQFLSKLTLLRNKQHINFNGLLPYLRGKMLIKPCKTEMHCLPHQEWKSYNFKNRKRSIRLEKFLKRRENQIQRKKKERNKQNQPTKNSIKPMHNSA